VEVEVSLTAEVFGRKLLAPEGLFPVTGSFFPGHGIFFRSAAEN
jgi:hypothetical protein